MATTTAAMATVVFYKKYYGQPPYAPVFIPCPSDRTAPPLRDGCPSQAPALCADRFARPSGRTVAEIAAMVFPSRDTVERVLNSWLILQGGGASPRRAKHPG
jgi:hypothetical protein